MIRFFQRVAIWCIDGRYLGTIVRFCPGGVVIVELDDERGTVKLPREMFE